MATWARKGDGARAPRHLTLGVLAVLGFAAGPAIFALALSADGLSDPVVHASLATWSAVPYVLCGVIAWARRPASAFGPLMVAAGLVAAASALSMSHVALLATVGKSLDLLPPVLFVHVFLAFPSGRLEPGFERALVAGGYVVAFGATVASEAIWGTAASPQVEAVEQVQLLAISALCLTALGILIARRRRSGWPLRRAPARLVDAFSVGLVMLAALFFSNAIGAPAIEPIRWATFAVIGLAPVAFLIGLVDARLQRASVGDLIVELGSDPGPGPLRDALARSLRDPSLELAFWLPTYATYADLEGRPLVLPQDEGGQAVRAIERDGSPVAALLHDPALEDEPELLEAVSAAAGIALENGRLQAELRARLDELQGSRARIIDAEQRERRRLERDLHDGAQQRLIALSLELGMLEAELQDDPGARLRLDRARAEITTSLRELRDVAHGLHPAVVTGHGLEVALEQLAALGAVPVQLSVSADSRLPERLEVAAFYVVAEGLANIAKHARAGSASVDVTSAGGQLVVEVVDDGAGGADTERGTGLRGLADRVEALDGRLRVWSPEGGGTRLRAELPCES
jgi:signal transduction histidine kinase